jgi:hypothetical protein
MSLVSAKNSNNYNNKHQRLFILKFGAGGVQCVRRQQGWLGKPVQCWLASFVLPPYLFISLSTSFDITPSAVD